MSSSKLGGAQPATNFHETAAVGTGPAHAVRDGSLGSRGKRRHRQVLPAEWQQPGTVAVGEEAEVSDADEASRQYVDQETAKELHG